MPTVLQFHYYIPSLSDILSEYVLIILGFYYELETCVDNSVFYSVMVFRATIPQLLHE